MGSTLDPLRCFYHTARSHPVATREQGACNRFRATVCRSVLSWIHTLNFSIPPRIDQESNPCPVATREQGACNRFRATVCRSVLSWIHTLNFSIPPRIDQESNPCPLLMNGAIWTTGPYRALSAYGAIWPSGPYSAIHKQRTWVRLLTHGAVFTTLPAATPWPLASRVLVIDSVQRYVGVFSLGSILSIFPYRHASTKSRTHALCL
jgi:hypothetical protein